MTKLNVVISYTDGDWPWLYAYQPDIEKQFTSLEEAEKYVKDNSIRRDHYKIETVNKISYSEFKSKSTCKL